MGKRERLEELRAALRMDASDPVNRLNKLRSESLRFGDLELAALCLLGLSERELDLDRRAQLQRQLVKEYPVFLAFRALAETEVGRGRLPAARVAYHSALHEAKEQTKEEIRLAIRSIDLALAGDDSAIADLRARRVQQESSAGDSAR